MNFFSNLSQLFVYMYVLDHSQEILISLISYILRWTLYCISIIKPTAYTVYSKIFYLGAWIFFVSKDPFPIKKFTYDTNRDYCSWRILIVFQLVFNKNQLVKCIFHIRVLLCKFSTFLQWLFICRIDSKRQMAVENIKTSNYSRKNFNY